MEASERGAQQREAEEKRRMGLRPNKPSYEDIPLLTPGNPVRVKVEGTWRKATIDCVNDEGTVDVSLDGPARAEAAGPAAEATVPAAAVRRLEAFEVRPEEERRAAFEEDLFGAVAKAKEDANAIFKLGDIEAAMDYYSKAIDELRRCRALQPGEACRVLLTQDGSLVLADVQSLDLSGQRATVVPAATAAGGSRQPRTLQWRALIRIHEGHMPLQGSLYMNRARCLMQSDRQQEAAQDLSVVVALWTAGCPPAAPSHGLPERLEQLAKALKCAACRRRAAAGSSERPQQPPGERREQLTKAYYLRAKTRLSRMRIEPARADAREAWALEPPDATAKLLRQLEREIEAAKKELLRSNKKIAKEIAKFADSAMSSLGTAQLEALGQPEGLPE